MQLFVLRRAPAALAVLLLAACSRDLELPAEPVGGGPASECPEVTGLAASPTPARAGSLLQITFSIAADLAAPPVVTVVGRQATAASGPGPGGAFSFAYTVVGDELPGGAATGAEGPVVVTFEHDGRGCSGATAVVLDLVPPSLESATTIPASGLLEPGETLELQLVASEPLAIAPTASAPGLVLPCAESAADGRRFACRRTLDGTERSGPVLITVGLRDAAGNEAAWPLEPELGVDLHGGTPPVIANLSISAPRARSGTELRIDFATDRQLRESSTAVTVDGRPGRPADAGAEPRSYLYLVTGAETQGEVQVEVTVTDLLSRQATARTSVVLDFTPPFLTSLTADRPSAGVGEAVSLALRFSEAVQPPAVTVAGRAAPCGIADGEALAFDCTFTADGSEPAGPQDVVVELLDLAGNSGGATSEDVFSLDLSCFSLPAQVRVLRRYGGPASLRAEPASFEPGATLDLFPAADLQARLGTTTADPQGGVAGFPVADSSELWVRATSPRGPVCAPFRARRSFTASFAGKLPGSTVENPGELRTGVLPRLFPALAALDSLPEADAAGYAATVVDDGDSLASAALPTAEDRAFTHLTPPAATCPFAADGYGAAFDAGTGELRVLGGSFSGGASWRWDGAAWSQGPADPGGERGSLQLACDPLRGFCVGYGGWNAPAGRYEQDTAIWDAAGLRRVGNAGGPGAEPMALTWDRIRGSVVGWSASGDLWTFDGTSWMVLDDLQDPASPGSWGSYAHLARDEAAGRLRMLDDDGSLLEYSPGLVPAYSLLRGADPSLVQQPLAWHPGVGRLVAGGGSGVREWDGGAFMSVGAGGDLPPPGGLYRLALALDPARDVALLVAAIDRSSFPGYGCDGLNVWEYGVRSDTPVASARLVVPPELAAAGATLSLRSVAHGTGQGLAGPLNGARVFLRDPATGRFVLVGASPGGPGHALADRTVTHEAGALGPWVEADGSIRLVIATAGPATRGGPAELGLDALELVVSE